MGIMNSEQTISIEANQTGFETDMRAGNRGVSPLEITRSDHLRRHDPELYQELVSSDELETIRQNLFSLLHKREMALFSDECEFDTLERSNALNCIGVMKNLFSRRNEVVSQYSTISTMLEIVREHPGKIKEKRRAAYSDLYLHRPGFPGALGHLPGVSADLPLLRRQGRGQGPFGLLDVWPRDA